MIYNWRKAWKFWSLQLQAVGLAALAFPEVLLDAWQYLPDNIKAMLPDEYASVVGLTLIAAGMIARLIKQEKVHEKKS